MIEVRCGLRQHVRVRSNLGWRFAPGRGAAGRSFESWAGGLRKADHDAQLGDPLHMAWSWGWKHSCRQQPLRHPEHIEEEVVEEKVEEVVEEKVVEVVEEKVVEVEEKVEEVVEEKVEDEKPKSKGIFSRVKNLFKRK